ncbi:hypothetical protein [Lachnoclostridium sp. Marseille-P6806]|uniref:hypothetical protein n=1 Tax=Lachnoclostridium sp. Marseille-P6806 TaxID=2364793 RepID=UPI001031BC54|nr:hypothetical protein [Lachnoclostridium sp. Marseille-P6806]
MLLSVSAGLKGAGIVLLWVLGILMALLLLALFLPIRYEIRGIVEDPEPHEELQTARLRERLSFRLRFSWLFRFVSGGISYPGDPELRVRVLGITVSRTRWSKEQNLNKEQKPDKAQKPDKEAAPARGPGRRGEAGSVRETDAPHEAESSQTGAGAGKTGTAEQTPHRSSAALGVARVRFGSMAENIRYYTEILRSDRFRRAFHRVSGQLKKVLRMLLPVKWRLSGTVGLGDPEKTGQLLSGLALLWPFIRGHVELAPEFMAYRADVRGEAAGKIRLFTAAVCVLILYFDRDVRETLQLFRKENSENDGRAE